MDALKYEALDMEDCIHKNDNGEILQLTRDVNQILTQIRSAWGFKYPFE